MTKYVADVQIEIEIDNDDLDGEEAAFAAIDETLQRAWDTDQGRAWLAKNWHFSMLEGCVTKVVDETADAAETRTKVRAGLGYPPASTDEGLEEDQRLIRKYNDDEGDDR